MHHWDEHPMFPLYDWRAEIRNDDTRLGYKEWCEAREDEVETRTTVVFAACHIPEHSFLLLRDPDTKNESLHEMVQWTEDTGQAICRFLYTEKQQAEKIIAATPGHPELRKLLLFALHTYQPTHVIFDVAAEVHTWLPMYEQPTE